MDQADAGSVVVLGPMEGTRDVLGDAVGVPDEDLAQLSTGRTLESSPIRIAVTRAWARLEAPSFW